jgi:Trypsin-like peptidase domain
MTRNECDTAEYVVGDVTYYIDYFSLSSVRLQMLSETEKHLGSATAFHVTHEERDYLVTNWHVVTGKHPETGSTSLQSRPAILRTSMLRDGPGPMFWSYVDIPLYDEGNNPLWIEHPQEELTTLKGGGKPDVVAIRLKERIKQVGFHPMSLGRSIDDLFLSPGSTVHIIGFPYGLTGTDMLPLWITAFVASDTETHVDLPFFFVSGMTKPAMSGSPVVFRAWGPYATKSGNMTMRTDRPTMFVGVYSGRLSTRASRDQEDSEQVPSLQETASESTEDSSIGKVWKPEVLFQVLANASARILFQKFPDFPFGFQSLRQPSPDQVRNDHKHYHRECFHYLGYAVQRQHRCASSSREQCSQKKDANHCLDTLRDKKHKRNSDEPWTDNRERHAHDKKKNCYH